MLNPFTHRKILKKGVEGKATIVAMGSLDRGGTSFNLPMTLHVYVEGSPPYEVQDQWMVKAKDAIALSGLIPVKVDPDDQTRVAIHWEALRAQHEQEETARREALATLGPVADVSALGGLGDFADQFAAAPAEPQGVTPVIDLQGDAELRRKLEAVLGRELTPGTTETIATGDPELQFRVMQVVQEHMAAKAAPPQPSTDATARLRQLANLHEAGLITDDEYDAKKAEILREL